MARNWFGEDYENERAKFSLGRHRQYKRWPSARIKNTIRSEENEQQD